MVGIPFSYLGAITRTYYGPDTARASFETDVSHIFLFGRAFRHLVNVLTLAQPFSDMLDYSRASNLCPLEPR
jgi:hypothetical protein